MVKNKLYDMVLVTSENDKLRLEVLVTEKKYSMSEAEANRLMTELGVFAISMMPYLILAFLCATT